MSRFYRIFNWLNQKLPPPTEDRLRDLVEKDRQPLEEFKTNELVKDPVTLGREAFSKGRYAEALASFAEAIEYNSTNSWAWHGRGDALQLLGEPNGALAAYQKAASLAPDVGLHHGGIANALMALNRSQEAEGAMSKALELDDSLSWMNPKIQVKNAT